MRTILRIFQDTSHSFEGQEVGEEVVLLLRHHPFHVLVRVGFFLIGCLIPALIGPAIWPLLVEKELTLIFWLVTSAWLLALWLGMFYTLTMYSLNVVIITNERIVESEQFSLFNRKISELHIQRIQDISVHTQGIIPTMLSFGDIVVQTASTEQQFSFHSIPYPETVKDTIMQIVASKKIVPTAL